MKKSFAKSNRAAGLLAALLLSLLLACTGAAQTAAPAQDLLPRVDEYLSGLAKQNRFSGSVLIARGGKVLVSNGD